MFLPPFVFLSVCKQDYGKLSGLVLIKLCRTLNTVCQLQKVIKLSQLRFMKVNVNTVQWSKTIVQAEVCTLLSAPVFLHEKRSPCTGQINCN